MFNRNSLLVVLMAAGTGCATTPSSAQQVQSTARTISAEDIAITGGSTALDGVFLLRPGIQTGRAIPTGVQGARDLPVVYLDGVRVDFDVLGSVHRSELASMEYIGAMDANMRYGPNHQGGAFVVRTQVRQ